MQRQIGFLLYWVGLVLSQEGLPDYPPDCLGVSTPDLAYLDITASGEMSTASVYTNDVFPVNQLVRNTRYSMTVSNSLLMPDIVMLGSELELNTSYVHASNCNECDYPPRYSVIDNGLSPNLTVARTGLLNATSVAFSADRSLLEVKGSMLVRSCLQWDFGDFAFQPVSPINGELRIDSGGMVAVQGRCEFPRLGSGVVHVSGSLWCATMPVSIGCRGVGNSDYETMNGGRFFLYSTGLWIIPSGIYQQSCLNYWVVPVTPGTPQSDINLADTVGYKNNFPPTTPSWETTSAITVDTASSYIWITNSLACTTAAIQLPEFCPSKWRYAELTGPSYTSCSDLSVAGFCNATMSALNDMLGLTGSGAIPVLPMPITPGKSHPERVDMYCPCCRCADVDMCQLNNGGCEVSAGGVACTYRTNSHVATCVCLQGYTANPARPTTSCVPYDPCTMTVGICPGQSCVTDVIEPGSVANYTGYGYHCVDNSQASSSGVSTSVIAGASVGGACAIVAFLAVLLVQRRSRAKLAARLKEAQTELQGAGKLQWQNITATEVNLVKVVGEGFSALVHKAVWHGTEVAAKKLRRQDQNSVTEFNHEVAMSKRLGNHPRVVGFLGACETPPDLMLVLAFMPFGSVEDFLIRDKKYPVNDKTPPRDLLPNFKVVLGIAVDASAGILHCHQSGVIHRDIATRNFLLDPYQRVTVCDFGISLPLYKGENFGYFDPLVPIPLKWAAPEVLQYYVYSTKTDVYMFAILLSELVTRTVPYPRWDAAEVAQRVTRADNPIRPIIPGYCHRALASLMQRCWSPMAIDRPSMDDVNRELIALQERVDASLLQLAELIDSNASVDQIAALNSTAYERYLPFSNEAAEEDEMEVQKQEDHYATHAAGDQRTAQTNARVYGSTANDVTTTPVTYDTADVNNTYGPSGTYAKPAANGGASIQRPVGYDTTPDVKTPESKRSELTTTTSPSVQITTIASAPLNPAKKTWFGLSSSSLDKTQQYDTPQSTTSTSDDDPFFTDSEVADPSRPWRAYYGLTKMQLRQRFREGL